jgi:simple sugar transport system ATP-binding protein
VIELRGLSKSFHGVQANADIHLRVKRGTIHAVIGENGAGKSTAMKMLYGMIQPDGGEILVDGVARHWKSPSDAMAAGIGMVHQHFMLADRYSAIENVLLGAEESRWGWIPRWFRPVSWGPARTRLRELSRKFGMHVDWNKPIEELSVGVHQRIEILKLLYRNSSVLILDEPTAVLTPQEIRELFQSLRDLKNQGKTILIITHKLKEVLEISDDVTVFRAGRVVGERKTSETNAQELASLMVGRKVSLRVDAPPVVPLSEKPFLEISKAVLVRTGKQKLSGVSFSLRGGEILGIAGVEGNGQSELIEAILRPIEKLEGEVRVLGQESRGCSPREIKDLGVGVIPEDRHREGLLMERPLRENFILGLQRLSPFSKAGFLRERKIAERARAAFEEYDVRPRDLEATARSLSGGNQQKVIIAREFQRAPRLLIAAQPTRGVDVGAIEMLHQRLLRARNEGAAILLISSELDEVLALSDRILVLFDGRVTAEFSRADASEDRIGIAMGGGHA